MYTLGYSLQHNEVAVDGRIAFDTSSQNGKRKIILLYRVTSSLILNLTCCVSQLIYLCTVKTDNTLHTIGPK